MTNTSGKERNSRCLDLVSDKGGGAGRGAMYTTDQAVSLTWPGAAGSPRSWPADGSREGGGRTGCARSCSVRLCGSA